jgi:hypothetical protein
MPTGQGGPVSTTASHFHANTACPSGGIVFSPGDNGTYSVAVNSSCKLKGPPDDTGCGPTGYPTAQYTFAFMSGSSNGTLSSTTQNGSNSVATFQRTSTGTVVIQLNVTYREIKDSVCHTDGGSIYGYVTLD